MASQAATDVVPVSPKAAETSIESDWSQPNGIARNLLKEIMDSTCPRSTMFDVGKKYAREAYDHCTTQKYLEIEKGRRVASEQSNWVLQHENACLQDFNSQQDFCIQLQQGEKAQLEQQLIRSNHEKAQMEQQLNRLKYENAQVENQLNQLEQHVRTLEVASETNTPKRKRARKQSVGLPLDAEPSQKRQKQEPEENVKDAAEDVVTGNELMANDIRREAVSNT